MTVTEASFARDATRGPSCANRETRPRPLHPRSWPSPCRWWLPWGRGAGRQAGSAPTPRFDCKGRFRQGPGSAERSGADCGPSQQRAGSDPSEQTGHFVWRRPRRPIRCQWYLSGVRRPPDSCWRPSLLRAFGLSMGKSREPTSGHKNRLPLLQLRVTSQVLQGLAGVCKSRISRLISFLWFALCCTVLRSRWCQSGVKMSLGAQVGPLEGIPCGIPIS